jgi:Na+/melibiose symporter-like transporter
MHGIIAMAGLAEAAEFYGLVIFTGALLIAAGILALAWWKRWWFAALIGCIICLFTGWLTQPWNAINPPITNDPDESYWLFRWRIFAFFWAALCVVGVACFCTSIRDSKSWIANKSGLKSNSI